MAATFARGTLHEGELLAGAGHPFAIRLPDDALPTLVSEHGELYWEAGAVSDERGLDTSVWERFAVDTKPPPREAPREEDEPASIWLSSPDNDIWDSDDKV